MSVFYVLFLACYLLFFKMGGTISQIIGFNWKSTSYSWTLTSAGLAFPRSCPAAATAGGFHGRVPPKPPVCLSLCVSFAFYTGSQGSASDVEGELSEKSWELIWLALILLERHRVLFSLKSMKTPKKCRRKVFCFNNLQKWLRKSVLGRKITHIESMT